MDHATAEADLLARARAGDDTALSELYELHYEAARGFAGSLVRDASDADDLAADAFARVVAQLRDGRGPSSSFRAYLLSAVRNRHIDVGRRSSRVTPASDRPWIFDDAAPSEEPPEVALSDGDAVAAFASLPESWQQVLWHIEVEGRPVAEVANLLDTRPATVSSLVYRAREGLRLAYLDRQVGSRTPASDRCRWVSTRMSQYVRGGLSERAARRAEEHLAGCADCSAAMLQVERTNRKLAALLLPIVLVGGYAGLDAGLTGVAGAPGAAPDSGSGGRTPRPRSSGKDATGVLRRLVSHAGSAPGIATVAASVVALTCAAAVALWPASDAPADRPDGPRAPAAQEPQATPAGTEPTPKPAVATLPRPPSVVETEPTPEPTLPPAPVGPQRPAPPTALLPLIQVTPVAPVAVPVGGCGTSGSLALPSTEGVRYARTAGDGRSGPWKVRATAREGYVIADGARTTFSGDLGALMTCPTFSSVSRTNTGDPSGTVWSVAADIDARDAASYTAAVELRFDVTVFTGGFSGVGWSCFATDGGSRQPLDGADYQIEPGAQWIVCEHSYTGADPGAVQVTVDTVAVADPSGTATALRDGVVTATRRF